MSLTYLSRRLLTRNTWIFTVRVRVMDVPHLTEEEMAEIKKDVSTMFLALKKRCSLQIIVSRGGLFEIYTGFLLCLGFKRTLFVVKGLVKKETAHHTFPVPTSTILRI